uniref:Uncharacterized protein n=1 Tax=Oryza glaberrima TaxID=4538 RepID=I1PTM0_ORYGL
MVGRIRRDDGSGDNPAREGAASADPTWHGEARRRRIRPPLRAPRTRIRLRWCVSGGSTADPVTGRLRATAEAAADRAAAPRPTHTAVTSAAASSNTEGHGGAAANTSMTLRR